MLSRRRRSGQVRSRVLNEKTDQQVCLQYQPPNLVVVIPFFFLLFKWWPNDYENPPEPLCGVQTKQNSIVIPSFFFLVFICGCSCFFVLGRTQFLVHPKFPSICCQRRKTKRTPSNDSFESLNGAFLIGGKERGRKCFIRVTVECLLDLWPEPILPPPPHVFGWWWCAYT